MRHASKNHKKHMSDLIRVARKTNLPLIHLIELYAADSEAKHSVRLINRFGVTADWNNVKITRFIISVPLVTLNGRNLNTSFVIHSLGMINRLENKYKTECPDEVKEKISKALQEREARKELTKALSK